jgi:hypothetical protein
MKFLKCLFIAVSILSIPSPSSASIYGLWSKCEVEKGYVQLYVTIFDKKDERLEILILGPGESCIDLKDNAKIAQVNRWNYKIDHNRIDLTLLDEKLFFFDKILAQKNNIEVSCSFKDWLHGRDEDCGTDIRQRSDLHELAEDRMQKSIKYKTFKNNSLYISDSPFVKLEKN